MIVINTNDNGIYRKSEKNLAEANLSIPRFVSYGLLNDCHEWVKFYNFVMKITVFYKNKKKALTQF